MGFHFPDNFRNPYLSKSMTEFFRRWHITLGSWFREYVYIPLGGNRKHQYRNLFLVWLLTGLWHGASWNYLLWSGVCFILICMEKAALGKILNRIPALGHLYMLFMIPLTWLLFAITDIGEIFVYLNRLFPVLGVSDSVVFQGDFLKYIKLYALPFAGAIVCCSGLPRKVYEAKKKSWIVALILVILFWLCIYSMYIGLDDPFLYYQF